MEPRRDDLDLAAELRVLRPAPRQEFVAEMDARAEAGFPRRGRGGGALDRVAERLRATPPRRFLAPAGACAVAAIAIATAVVTTSQNGQDSLHPNSERLSAAPAQPDFLEQAAPAPSLKSLTPTESASAARGDSGAGDTSSTQAGEAAVPLARTRSSDSGPYASQAGRREIERSAQMVLGAEPTEVRTAAAKVFDAVHTADGIVLNSAIRDGSAGRAGASFDLLIPSGRLGDTLAAFSSIAEVRSRHEATQDITAPTVGVGERLRDTQATIEGLLGQLAAAETNGERVAVEAELRAERRQAAVLRFRLSTLRRRANFSRVSLRIETGTPAAADPGGSWGVSDALGDAGHILGVAAGVAIVGFAILVLPALFCLLVWLARRLWVSRDRQRALSAAAESR